MAVGKENTVEREYIYKRRKMQKQSVRQSTAVEKRCKRSRKID